MANILIAGDSWGIGVYTKTINGYAPTGEGIQSLLEQSGYKVINVSQAGDNNTAIVDRIKNKINQADFIIFLQTDIFREHSYHIQKDGVGWRMLKESFVDQLITYPNLSEYYKQYFLNLYNQLNSLNKTIYCIGGWSALHPSISKFENLINLIPSATELIIPDTKDVYISDFEYFIQLNNNKDFMDKFDIEFKQLMLDSSKKFEICCKHWNDVHPDIHGYQKIVDVLAKIFENNRCGINNSSVLCIDA
jgi:hypothetical protein